MPVSDLFRPRIAAKLRRLYGSRARDVLQKIDQLTDRYAFLRQRIARGLPGPQSIVLITYGDQIRSEGRPSLRVLNGFLHEYGCDKVISNIHTNFDNLGCVRINSDGNSFFSINPEIAGLCAR